jgi:hypothetical protein
MNGLFGSPVLEVGIGLAFVYLLLALICTTLNEWLLSYFLNLRPKLLDRTLDKRTDWLDSGGSAVFTTARSRLNPN